MTILFLIINYILAVIIGYLIASIVRLKKGRKELDKVDELFKVYMAPENSEKRHKILEEISIRLKVIREYNYFIK